MIDPKNYEDIIGDRLFLTRLWKRFGGTDMFFALIKSGWTEEEIEKEWDKEKQDN